MDTGEILYTCHPGAFGTMSRYIFTLGLWHFWRKATTYTVTEKGVTFRSGLIFVKRSRMIPVRMIQDVNIGTAPLIGRVTLSTAGGALSVEKTLWLSRNDAHAMTEAIRALIG